MYKDLKMHHSQIIYILKDQADLYEAFLRREQVGRRRHFPVSMGVHYIRAAARSARHARRSHSLIFLDLQEAFYRVLRPAAIGGRLTDALLAQVAARLHLPDDVLRDLQSILQMPSATELAGLPHIYNERWEPSTPTRTSVFEANRTSRTRELALVRETLFLMLSLATCFQDSWQLLGRK